MLYLLLLLMSSSSSSSPSVSSSFWIYLKTWADFIELMKLLLLLRAQLTLVTSMSLLFGLSLGQWPEMVMNWLWAEYRNLEEKINYLDTIAFVIQRSTKLNGAVKVKSKQKIQVNNFTTELRCGTILQLEFATTMTC